ncbi:unnamed protein product [Caenorhabditis angaria]|uniref:Protein kinase domain-containing protein n=1 Tax=Caenorhabditis angaria TaxID=860376 RepID=A0A9P1NBD2_9PELO|nr:unnamed protein product [Caenorhabditis angaria]
MKKEERPSSSCEEEKNVVLQKFRDLLKSSSIETFLSPGFDHDTKILEKNYCELVGRITKIKQTDKERREILSTWLTFVGLSAQNIRHLEICSITVFDSLLKISQTELRSLADRGRFDAETKRKLLQSTVILQSHCQHYLHHKRDSIEEPPGPSTSTPNTACNIPSLMVGGNKILQSTSMNFSSAPKSPKTSSRFVHAIPHKWHRSTKFRFSGDAVCHFCQRPLGFGFLNAWEKCRSCKWKVHTQCKGRVGDSCGLTPDHLRFLFDKLIQENNGGMWNDPQSAVPIPGSRSMNEPAFQYPDTAIDSSSSTNSSAPSTPAMPLGVPGSGLNPLTAPYRSERKFLFPDTEMYSMHNKVPILVISEGDNHIEAKPDESEGTIVAQDSIGSNEAQSSEASDKFNRRNDGGHQWERHTWNMSTIRVPNTQASWNEVTIQPESIEWDKRQLLIGNGRFGKVLRGFHYGDVAVKMFDMNHIREKSKRAEEFKLEVSAYKNTRHDNIALFLGYFMSDDKYGLVMSLCKGSQTLYGFLHVEKRKLDLPTTRRLAQQICQGVSYLHTKKILHKDLRTKNVLLESINKVVITDFGVLSMRRLSYPKADYGYIAPKFWVNYIAPEIVASLRCDYDEFYSEELPFTEFSDVYAFGTLWYEMLTGLMPFKATEVERVLWMKGNGMKAVIPNVNCTREMKELLTKCWMADPNDRPTFVDINLKLTSLPRKQRVNRSPSFPVMMKSYESAF